MVDKDKAVLVGQADNIILEVAFLMDKLCADDTMGSKSSYSDTHGMILREVKKLQIERDGGYERSHPHDTEDRSNGSQSTNSRMTAAEEALEKAMLEIEKMKAEKAEKAAKADKKKAKKAKKKDR